MMAVSPVTNQPLGWMLLDLPLVCTLFQSSSVSRWPSSADLVWSNCSSLQPRLQWSWYDLGPLSISWVLCMCQQTKQSIQVIYTTCNVISMVMLKTKEYAKKVSAEYIFLGHKWDLLYSSTFEHIRIHIQNNAARNDHRIQLTENHKQSFVKHIIRSTCTSLTHMDASRQTYQSLTLFLPTSKPESSLQTPQNRESNLESIIHDCLIVRASHGCTFQGVQGPPHCNSKVSCHPRVNILMGPNAINVFLNVCDRYISTAVYSKFNSSQ